MDPQQTLNDMLDGIVARDWERVMELSDALLTWMENGGFPPEAIGSSELGKRWHRTIATFLCHAATSRADDALNRRRQRDSQ